jgi:hypothetical protein
LAHIATAATVFRQHGMESPLLNRGDQAAAMASAVTATEVTAAATAPLAVNTNSTNVKPTAVPTKPQARRKIITKGENAVL